MNARGIVRNNSHRLNWEINVSLVALTAITIAGVWMEMSGGDENPQPADCLCSPSIVGERSTRDASSDEIVNGEIARRECSRNYLFGTDRAGTDLFRKSITAWLGYMLPGILVIVVAASVGSLLGVLMGYYERTLGANLASIVANAISVYPSLILLILIVHILEPPLTVVAAAFGLTEASRLASSIVNKIGGLRREEFIAAAKEMGVPDRQIVLKHILWYNCREMMMIHTVFAVSGFIMAELYLGYLNVGNIHAWGELVGPQALGSLQHPWLLYLPTAVVVIAVASLYLLGDGIKRLVETSGGEPR